MDTRTKSHHKDISRNKWAPRMIAVTGALISLLLCLFLKYRGPHQDVLSTLTLTLPWIVLILGITISFLLAVISRLTQLVSERKQLLNQINTDFNNEMTDRIHAEETKQKLEKALLQGQKLQAIGTLAGGIAHDFNNLLYAIIGYVDMACEDTPKDSQTYKNLGKVLQAAHRGRELISRILAFSRRQHHEFKAICITETFLGVLALLKPTIPASVILNFNVKFPKEYWINGNETQLHQVIVNIINNAVDAMEGEGSVTITLSEVLAEDKLLLQFPKKSSTSYCRIDMTDTGHGMDQPTVQRIFEPFFTTKEVGKGTGLGLSTVHAIMEEHQGEILVTSQLGHGTTFTLLLPEYNNQEKQNGEDFTSRRR
jgi:signal transduction histidine kinase